MSKMHSFLELKKYKLMYYSFLELGEALSHQSAYVQQLVRLLPENIRSTYSLRHDDEMDLYYDFAAAYTGLKDSGVVLGGSQIIPLKALYQAMDYANRLLSPKQILLFLDKLGDPQKHFEQVFEFRPLMGLAGDSSPAYESSGSERKTVDWTISNLDSTFLVEVKVRHSTSLANFEKMISRSGNTSIDIGMPDTKPELILKSIEEKFVARTSPSTTGIAWIFSGSTENRRLLEEHFLLRMSPDKVQVIVFSGWNREASVIARDDSEKAAVCRLFGLIETARYLY
jgi:hypothetical protein